MYKTTDSYFISPIIMLYLAAVRWSEREFRSPPLLPTIREEATKLHPTKDNSVESAMETITKKKQHPHPPLRLKINRANIENRETTFDRMQSTTENFLAKLVNDSDFFRQNPPRRLPSFDPSGKIAFTVYTMTASMLSLAFNLTCWLFHQQRYGLARKSVRASLGLSTMSQRFRSITKAAGYPRNLG